MATAVSPPPDQPDAHAEDVPRKAANIPLLGRVPSYEKDPSRPLSELTTGLGNPFTEDNHRGCPGHSARLDDEHRPV